MWLVALTETFLSDSFPESNHACRCRFSGFGCVYDTKWSIFVNCCVGQEIDLIKVSVQQLADFVVHLLEDKGLLPSTIKGYISSITRTLTISGGTVKRVTAD
jgi:hypothetical protein